jgi:hypothetical protein
MNCTRTLAWLRNAVCTAGALAAVLPRTARATEASEPDARHDAPPNAALNASPNGPDSASPNGPESGTGRAAEGPASVETANAVQPSAESPVGAFTFAPYVEAFYAYNTNRPSNGLTHYRGFDNRHDSFTLANAVFDVAWQKGPLRARLAAQVGHTPNTYYVAEPSQPGAPGTAGSDATTTWKFLQQANVGYELPFGRGLLAEAGLFLSPIGIEAMPIKDNWNFSRSNLFFGLPFYHTGARLTQTLTPRWKLSAAVWNGWNSVVDGNTSKSVSLALLYDGEPRADGDAVHASLLYFGGNEREVNAPEGRPWRSLFDAWVSIPVVPRFSVRAHGNAGFEATRFGVSSWQSAALYARVAILPVLAFAARGDVFREDVGANATGRASAIFWPVSWVSSQTATLELAPQDGLSFRIEARRDVAEAAMYFRGAVLGDGTAERPFLPNARTQTTFTFGAIAWF